MADIARPPGLPSSLDGILNLAGTLIPVLRLDRLLNLPERRLGLYSMLIMLKGVSDKTVAFSVDRVTDVVRVVESSFLPASSDDSFNGCVKAVVPLHGELIPLLSPEKILLQKERYALADFEAREQQRLAHWELGNQYADVWPA